ncbi:MAG: hypothetical protein ACTSYG_07595 [Candidatus Heimdallarchaeota archaeon]
MSHSTGAELSGIRIKDVRTITVLKNEIEIVKTSIRNQEIAIAEMGKEIKALRHLITALKISNVESITRTFNNELE